MTISRYRQPLVAMAKLLWMVANSPLAIAIVTGVVITNIAREYSQRDEDSKELVIRTSKLDGALTELQQRLTVLTKADRLWTGRCNYHKSSKIEWDAITGSGDYQPSAPAYRQMNISLVLTEAHRASGAWDPSYDSSRLLGIFTIPPPETAIVVRAQLEWLHRYVFARTQAAGFGYLPLRRGEQLDPRLAHEFGLPTLEEAHKLAAKQHNDNLDAVNVASANPPKSCNNS